MKTVRNTKPRSVVNRSRKKRAPEWFERLAQQAVDEARDLGPAAQAHVRANCRLQIDYPGEYVAYIDTWTGQGKNLRFRRKILAHADSMGDLHDKLAKLPPRVRSKATFEYVDDPEGPLEVHYDLPFHG